MDAKKFIETFGWPEAEKIANKAGTNKAYLSQIAYGHRKASYALALKLVKASKGRLDLMSLINTSERAKPRKVSA